jgi:hypothetical protein
VIVTPVPSSTLSGSAPGAGFFCMEKASAGLPPGVLLSLPASSSDSTDAVSLGLCVGVTGSTRFTPPGVDVGFLRFSSLFGRNANFH